MVGFVAPLGVTLRNSSMLRNCPVGLSPMVCKPRTASGRGLRWSAKTGHAGCGIQPGTARRPRKRSRNRLSVSDRHIQYKRLTNNGLFGLSIVQEPPASSPGTFRLLDTLSSFGAEDLADNVWPPSGPWQLPKLSKSDAKNCQAGCKMSSKV